MKNKRNFKYQEYRIMRKEQISPDTFLFRILGNLKFSPGQFVQVALDHYGEGTFAPCSSNENKYNFELCIKENGNLSNQLVKLLPGSKIKIRGPYGQGWPLGKLIGKNILILTGGMGLVPLRPLIYDLLKHKGEFKKIYLVVGFKSDHHILFEEELKKWKNKIDYFKIFAERAGQNFWGEKGLITEPLKKISFDKKKTMILMCGPEVMYTFCSKTLLEKNTPENNIYISFERRMECGIGLCQHCNIGKYLVCRDGPIFSYDKIKSELNK